jgi:mannose-6-phosphate isomerase-like protein (cupin superfamily)
LTVEITSALTSGIRIGAAEALAQVPTEGKRVVPLLIHGTLLAEMYAPRGHDPQLPHTRDEVYVIAAGRGTFLSGTARQDFAPGDFLFVPAGMVHRFEKFSDDFAAWVMFYGPEGGELGTAKGTT